MKKIFFYTVWDFTNAKENGICKKIMTEIRFFEQNGYQVDYSYIKNGNTFVFYDGKERKVQKYNAIWNKYSANRSLAKYIIEKDYDYLYCRYACSDGAFLKFLKNSKKVTQIILVEIPTYPYDMELGKSIKDRVFLLIDKVYRRKLKKYVDRFVTYSLDKEIYGQKTISIVNGIDFSEILINEYKGLSDEINMIAVANLAEWHGYDRMLNGLGKYYENGGERKIHFYIVGDGQVVKDYEKIIQRYNLQEKVTLCGALFGDELDKVYRQCNIAVECLGIHRKKIFLSSSLKSREYAAKGLPMITSTSIDVFNEKEYPYIFKCKEDETDIDICQMIEFFDTVYNNKQYENVVREIREYAEQMCDIGQTMKPIVEYFTK